MAAGRAGANARRELYREHETIPPRGPLAALTVPGAISGWMLALEAARAHGGRLPLPDLLGAAIRHAREGYAVTRSQARLTAEKLAELKDVPGFAPTFLVDGRPPDAGSTLEQPALAATLDHLAHAGLDDLLPRRCRAGRSPAISIASAARSRAGTSNAAGRASPSRCRWRSRPAPSFNTPPPTQGLASLIILALFERCACPNAEGFDHVHGLIEATKRAFARARPRRDRSRSHPAAGRALSRRRVSRRRSAQDRSPQGRALAAPLW